MKQEDTIMWCDLCDRDTRHTYYSAGHERDLSHDKSKCHVCGAVWRGSTDEYEKEDNE